MTETKKNILQDTILPVLNKIGSNKYLIAMRDGISAIVPFTIIGSAFLLLTSLPFEGYDAFIEPYAPTLNIIYSVCMNYLSVVVVCSMTYQLAKVLNINRIFTMFYALISFLMACTSVENGLDLSLLGHTGMFTGIIISLVTCKIVEVFEKRNIGIKMPKGVPGMVTDSFNSLISGAVVLIFWWLIVIVLNININAILQTILSPLVQGLDTLPGCLVVVFISTFIWCCGINEAAISGVTYPVWYQFLAENTAAFQAGLPAPHFAAYGFQYFGMWITGTGVTGGLVILMLLSKSKMYKRLGQVSLVPAIFNINEPVAFGFPICLNPIMAIPYIGSSLILTVLSYVCTSIGLISPVVIGCPWTMPIPISGYLLSGGDWRNSVFQIAALLLSIVIYYPFFKYNEKQMLIQEMEETA